MKKVGIIDNYISNWHSNTYYKLFHEIAQEEGSEEYVITHIYTVNGVSHSNGETTEQWCERTGAVACETIKEVCDAVDVIMVLAPNNPEMHEELCKEPLKSGKCVYVDKTFAPDYASAKRIIDYGRENGANFWSSSATRFEPALKEFLSDNPPEVSNFAVSCGNVFEIYIIHLVELMNTFMKNGAKSVICRNNGVILVFEVTFKDGRKAFINQHQGASGPFYCHPEIDGKCKPYCCKDEFWKGFAKAILEFFETGKAPIPLENTLECIAVRSALVKAKENPNVEIEVEGN